MFMSAMEKSMPPLFIDGRNKTNEPTPRLERNQGSVSIQTELCFSNLADEGIIITRLVTTLNPERTSYKP